MYIWLTISSRYCSIPLALGLKERDGHLSTLCHSCVFACHQRVLKTFPGPGYLHSDDGVVWLWHPLVNLHMWLTISCYYGSIPLTLVLIGRDGDLGTLCNSWGFPGQQRVVKTFPGPGFRHSNKGVVWLWHPLGNLYIRVTIPSWYGSITLALGLIGTDGGLSTRCHSCGFPSQERVLKTFSGPGYLHSEDGVVWLWHRLVNLHILLTIWSCYDSIPMALGLIGRDDGLRTLCHSCGFACQQRVLKKFPDRDCLHSEDGAVWLWHPLVNVYIWLTISSCYGSIPLALGLRGSDDGLSTLCHSCRFACQQRVLKTFSGPGYLHSDKGVVWLWHPLGNLYIRVTISSCYGSIFLALGLITTDGGLRTLCHSCRFPCQQRVLKTFSGSGYLHSEDGVVWLWHRLVNLHILLTIFSCYGSIPLALRVDREGWWFEHPMSFLMICLSTKGAKNISWSWLSPLRGWGSLIVHFILLRPNPFGFRVDSEGWWFGHSML